VHLHVCLASTILAARIFCRSLDNAARKKRTFLQHAKRRRGRNVPLEMEPKERSWVCTGIARNPRIEAAMAKCETCGNDYDKAFQVTLNGSTHTFDSFECAIQALAPTCPNCGTHVVGHGVEKDDEIFCCAHCAKQEGITELRDRA
jgi:hypothetical protein